MKFLSTWSIRPETRKTAAARFMQNGAKPPAGITTIGRWHYADGSGGIHVFECNDARVLRDFAEEWSDVLEIHITPLVEDADAGASVAKFADRA